MADREGFEPSVTLLLHTLSKRAHSTTLTSALIAGGARSKKKFILFGNPFRHFFCRTGSVKMFSKFCANLSNTVTLWRDKLSRCLAAQFVDHAKTIGK